jgi:hypothetical protein
MGGFTRTLKAATKVFKKEEPKKQGIELAKSVDNKVADTQKDAANNIQGPTSLEIAAQNKRKGRKITNLTAKKTLSKDFKLSEKTLLG